MAESARPDAPSAAAIPASTVSAVSAVTAVSRGATLWAVVLLTGINLLNYIDRYVLPANIESVKRDIPMTDPEQGLALSAFIWVYMVTAPVFGRLGDTRTRKYLVAFGVAVWSIATAAASLAHSLAALLAARAAVGVGEAAYATMAPSLIGDYYPAAKRGRIMAVFYLATPVGSALGYILGGAITKAASWREAFLAVGLPGLAFAALALTLREPPRGQFDADGAAPYAHAHARAPSAGSLLGSLRALAGIREYVWTVAGYTAYTFALGGLSQWMPSYLQRVRHLEGAHANAVFGAITVVTGLVGTGVGGVVGEALRTRVRHPYLLLSAVSSAVGVPLAILAFRLGTPTGLWTALFFAEFFVFLSTGPINTALVNCLPAGLRTSGFAVSILAIHLLGDALSPTLIGVASKWSSLPTAVLIVPAALAVSAALWFYAARTLPVGSHTTPSGAPSGAPSGTGA